MSTRHDRRERERAKRAQKRGKRAPQRGGLRLSGWMTAAIVLGVAVLAILGLRAAGIFEPPPPRVSIDDVPTAPAGQAVGVQEDDRGNSHTGQRGQQVEYPPPLPPSSGAHWALPHAGWGVKDTPQEDELVLHNLEHGGVAIQYKPGLEPQQLSDLKTLVRNLNGQGFPKVLLRPYADMDKPIVATAWRWRLALDRYDQSALVQFVRAHYGTNGISPEPNSP